MNHYPTPLVESLVKAEQATGMAADDVLAAIGKAGEDEALRIVLGRLLKRLSAAQRTLRRLSGIGLLALILSAPGCATARSQLVATWEPQPDVHIAYCYTLGTSPKMSQLTE